MKIDDPKLTAYALGELNADETRSVKKAIDADPKLTKEVKAIEETAAILCQAYQKAEPTLTAEQRGKIFATGGASNIEDISSHRQRATWKTWTAASVGIAAAIIVTLSLAQQNHSESATDNYAAFSYEDLSAPFSSDNTAWDSKAGAVALPAQLSKVAQASQMEPKKFQQALLLKADKKATPLAKGDYSESAWVTTAKQNSTTIPLVSGVMSWQWVRESLKADKMVNPALIRTEEIINSFQQPFTADFEMNSLRANLQFMQSPWNEQTVLAVVQLKNSGKTLIQDISAGLVFKPVVSEFRVIGYRESNSKTPASPNKVHMEPGYAHTVIYELKLAEKPINNAVLATLQLRSGEQQKSFNYEYAQQSIEETDLSARLPVVVAFWSQWMAKSENINLSTAPAQLQKELDNLSPQIKTPELLQTLELLEKTLK